MQTLRNTHLLLGACVLTTVAVLGAAALGSAASEQMAAKRRIALQFREDLQDCRKLDADAVELCARHAHAWAEVAHAELAARRVAPAHPPAEEGRMVAHCKMVRARCSALAGWIRARSPASMRRES